MVRSGTRSGLSLLEAGHRDPRRDRQRAGRRRPQGRLRGRQPGPCGWRRRRAADHPLHPHRHPALHRARLRARVRRRADRRGGRPRSWPTGSRPRATTGSPRRPGRARLRMTLTPETPRLRSGGRDRPVRRAADRRRAGRCGRLPDPGPDGARRPAAGLPRLRGDVAEADHGAGRRAGVLRAAQ